MANTHQIAWKASTKSVILQAAGAAIPATYSKIGEFEHANVEADIDDLQFDENHALYHHVRDALYKQGFTDMAMVSITISVDSIAAYPATVTLAIGETQQITTDFTPANPSNKTLTYSSNHARATVSSTGLITAVGPAGSATITVTSQDGTKTDTVVVTVS